MSYDKERYEKNKYTISKQRKQSKIYKEQALILCKICNTHIGAKGFSKHLKKFHKTQFKEYVKLHLDDFKVYGWTTCIQCGVLTKGVTCSRACKNSYLSEEYTGRTPWNLGVKMSDDYKSKLSAMRAGRQGTPHTEETKQKLSKITKQRASSPGYVNPMTGKTHTQEALRKIFSKKKNTKPEQKIAEILQQHQIEFIQQWFLREDGNTYSYDFYLPSTNMLLEVDGDYWHGGPGVKVHWAGVDDTTHNDRTKDMVAINQGYKIVRIWESQIKALSDEQVLEQLNQTRI